MHDPSVFLKRWAALTLSALALCAVRPAVAQIPQTVMLGSDYFQTAPGTSADLPGLGTVDFMGVPLGSWMGHPTGNADTVVQRQKDADITSGSATIPIQIVALSLESTAPVNIGGSFFDVFVTLDPNPTGSQDKGTMTINGTTAGGTFDSSFDVFFDITAKPVGGGMSMFLGTGEVPDMGSTGTPWSPVPPPETLLIDGPFGDQNANHHTSGIPTNENEVDFFPSVLPPGVIIPNFPQTPVAVPTGVTTGEKTSRNDERHFVVLAKTPEPSSMVLFGAGALVPLACALRRRRA